MAIKISVIMPVYNCERYLEAALRSVLSQSVTDLEVIAVDDCSTDASRDILSKCAQADPRIRPIFNEKNLGVSATRNRALDAVQGEYIAFCDADDIVPEGAYEALLKTIRGKDIAIGSFDDVFYEDIEFMYSNHCQIIKNARKSCFLSLFAVCCLWTKLIRTDFVRSHQLRFDESMTIGEDVVFLANVATFKPRYAVTDTSVYCHNHYLHSSYCSLTHQYTLAAYEKHIECRQKLLQICRNIPECREYVYLTFSSDTVRYMHLLESREDKRRAFALFSEFIKGYDYENEPLYFKALTGVPFEIFVHMDADGFFEYAPEPRERVATEFDIGLIGFRWIMRYFRGWLSFKFRRKRK